MIKSIVNCLDNSPIIAAIPNDSIGEDDIPSSVEVVFILSSNILTIEDRVNALKKSGRKVFVHMDLIDGLGKDLVSVKYVNERIKPHGIISTRNNLLRYGKEVGLITVQRLFLIDSMSFVSGINMIKNYEPDFVEVMPGLIPRAIDELKRRISQPIIAGGMVTQKSDIIQVLKAGAIAVSTSNMGLWDL